LLNLFYRKLNRVQLRDVVITCKEYLNERIDNIVELSDSLDLLEAFAKKLDPNNDDMRELEYGQAMLSISDSQDDESESMAIKDKVNDDTSLSDDVVGFFETFFRYVYCS
jgi:hypothetical protein